MTKSNFNRSVTKGRRSKRNISSKATMISLVMILAVLSAVAYSGNQRSLATYLPKRFLTTETADIVGKYDQDSIIKAAPHFPKFVPKLLVWDGDRFQVFGLKHRNTEYFETTKYTYRYVDTVPLMVHALQTNFPERFKKGSPPFELLFSDADSPHSKCVNTKDCPVEEFSPMVLFGSVPKDQTVFPTLRAFPNPAYARCLYEYQINGKDTPCQWSQKVNKDIAWDDLQETIVWRGADWAFMPYDDRFAVDGPQKLMESMSAGKWKGKSRDEIIGELLSEPLVNGFGPRWRAGILSAQAEGQEVPWIDSRFVGGENVEIHQALARKGANITGGKMDALEMSNYKYQIDFGGGGGTTWEGTLTKLLMPGVLLHHETPNRDWFYDMIEPWKHYIPVDWDLSNLQSAYSVVQNNPDRAYAVSQEATRLGEYLLSPQYMADVYQELFVEYLGKLVSNYLPPEMQWTEMVKKYKKKGFEVYDIGVCQDRKCSIQCRAGEKSDVLFINADAPKRGTQPGLRGVQQDKPQYVGQLQHEYPGAESTVEWGQNNDQKSYGHSSSSWNSVQDSSYGSYGNDGLQDGGYNSDPYNDNGGHGKTLSLSQEYGEQDQAYGQLRQLDARYNGSAEQSHGRTYTAAGVVVDNDADGYSQVQGQGSDYIQEAGWSNVQGGGGVGQFEGGDSGYDHQEGDYSQPQGRYDQVYQDGGYAQLQGGWDQQVQQNDNSQYEEQGTTGGSSYEQAEDAEDPPLPQARVQALGVVSESRRGRRRGRGRNLGTESVGYGASTIQHDQDAAVDTDGTPRGPPNDLQQKFLSAEELAAVGVKRLI